MKISELAASTDVPLATIKLYQREGLLMPGDRTSKTQATYGQEHIDRVRLIRTLASMPGYSYRLLRELLGLVHESADTLPDRVAAAMRILPTGASDEASANLAVEAARNLGVELADDAIVAPQLGAALAAAEAVGLPCSPERLAAYWEHILAIAEIEISGMAGSVSEADAVQYAIVGTAVYEPVILALRRLAHQQLFVNAD